MDKTIINYKLAIDISTSSYLEIDYTDDSINSNLEIDYVDENVIIENGIYYFYNKNNKTSNKLISYDIIIYVIYDNNNYKFFWDGLCYKDVLGSLTSNKVSDNTYIIDEFLIIKKDNDKIKKDEEKIKYNFPYNIYIAIKNIFCFNSLF